ncbi:RNA-binding domain-containing protein [Microbulbifer halophilus]|uniref:RNA-binding domain-containing protein n=1 Tax=Microbulbifer halophilus TaxID=453963 RepID=A0ABW5EFM6_9GAMM|nr:RNA-binding domain-containing protein [Microbulbifer halophilus]MCW8127610.1 putative DNA binding domain-containing protein [Microbulbifer halophilus]
MSDNDKDIGSSMMEIDSLEDIAALKESVDVECKLAAGRDGNGKLPKDFWETYSAFANTYGGDVFLGIRELAAGRFELAGIDDPDKVIDELWTGLNNPQKVSNCVLRDRWVRVLTIDGHSVIHIHIPQATRKQRPVYIKGNPLVGTYIRRNSTDQRQGEESVRRMLAEQVEDSRDGEILRGYGLDDLDIDSFNQYRQMYINRQPDHPWNQLDAQEFLYRIGGWRRDRETGHSGLTRAGLLMFGQLTPIKEAFPNYMLDYQERPEPRAELRWVDRLTLDGSWSGNLFDFYRRVIRKLTTDLKIPFLLEGDQRQDDTSVHKALREALVNTLVHADFSGRASILVVKRPDMFGFRNPGLMRVPVDIAVAGGNSDCRNRLLQDMFRYIGLGENAGSGLPKIFQGWAGQHWRRPVLREHGSPSEQTLLELHMLSLVPEKVLGDLEAMLGDQVFAGLTDNERLVLATARIEITVDHSRMMSILDLHPRDLTLLFSGLVDKGLLERAGSGRGTVYFLPDARARDLLAESDNGEGDIAKGPELGSGPLAAGFGHWELLRDIARPVAARGKAPREEVESVIKALCEQQSLRLEELEQLLNRSAESLRKHYLQPLVKSKQLQLKYPTKPNHPQQAYQRGE